ncbi:MAG: discoidin domain-containing protein, partial [Planctomycetales bacterium]|nr:discoidin domain-containing protein [Planctomycetales bacterium]
EFAFNVFDNVLGGGNDKWCCGKAGGISDNEPSWVQAKLSEPFYLTSFTLSSANDVPERDPSSWALQGSNNGVDFTDIYVYDDAAGPWTERLQVIKFNGGDDFPTQTESYDYFRLAVFNTPNNPNGAYLQLSEIELFGAAVPEPSSLVLMLLGVTGAGLHRRRW